MAITLVQEKGATGASVTLTSTPASGNLLVVAYVWRNGTSVAPPTGFTERAFAGSKNGDGVAIASKISAGTESGAIAFTGSSTSTNIVCYEFAGVAASGSEYDKSSAGATGSSATAQPGSLTPAASGAVFVLVEGYSSGAHGPWSVDSSFNAVETGVITGASHSYKIQSGSATAENPTVTATTTGPFEIQMSAFTASTVVAAVLPERNSPRGSLRGTLRGTT